METLRLRLAWGESTCIGCARTPFPRDSGNCCTLTDKEGDHGGHCLNMCMENVEEFARRFPEIAAEVECVVITRSIIPRTYFQGPGQPPRVISEGAPMGKCLICVSDRRIPNEWLLPKLCGSCTPEEYHEAVKPYLRKPLGE